jgi:cytochrome d ubiquinol oxidase subunit I
VAFAVMGVHAWMLRRTPDSLFHQRAFALAFGLALVATPLQLVTGDLSAKHIAKHQPVKLAAAEALYTTQAGAPLKLLGLHVPKMLSVLAFADPDAIVQGLDQVPEDERPPVAVVHWAFQIMVLCGLIMLAIVAWGALLWRRRGAPWKSRRFLTACVWAAPCGLIAVEAGWTVTEVGRQPWVIAGVMRTADAVTPMPGLVVPLVAFCALYLVLGVVVIGLLRAHVFRT